jgi:hypothetical protein
VTKNNRRHSSSSINRKNAEDGTGRQQGETIQEKHVPDGGKQNRLESRQKSHIARWAPEWQQMAVLGCSIAEIDKY